VAPSDSRSWCLHVGPAPLVSCKFALMIGNQASTKALRPAAHGGLGPLMRKQCGPVRDDMSSSTHSGSSRPSGEAQSTASTATIGSKRPSPVSSPHCSARLEARLIGLEEQLNDLRQAMQTMPPTMRQGDDMAAKCREDAEEAARHAETCMAAMEEMKSKCVAATEEVKDKVEAIKVHFGVRLEAQEARLEAGLEQEAAESRRFVEERLRASYDDLVSVWKGLETGEHAEKMCRSVAEEFERRVVKQVVAEASAEARNIISEQLLATQAAPFSAEKIATSAREAGDKLRLELEVLSSRLQGQALAMREHLQDAADRGEKRQLQLATIEDQFAQLEDKVEGQGHDIDELRERAQEESIHHAILVAADLKVARLSEKVEMQAVKFEALEKANQRPSQVALRPGLSSSTGTCAEVPRRLRSASPPGEQVLSSLRSMRNDISRIRSSESEGQDVVRVATLEQQHQQQQPSPLASPMQVYRTISMPSQKMGTGEGIRLNDPHASLTRLTSSPALQHSSLMCTTASNLEVQRQRSSPVVSREVVPNYSNLFPEPGGSISLGMSTSAPFRPGSSATVPVAPLGSNMVYQLRPTMVYQQANLAKW